MIRAHGAATGLVWARVRQILILFAGVGLLLVAIIAVGKLTRESISNQDRYRVAFLDIDCVPPAGQARRDFLTEVQYLSGMPDSVQILQPDLASRLADAFASHPWVEKVAEVAVLPAKQIQVLLVYRTPVLAVKDSKNLKRGVDQHGVLLPSTADLNGLPVLCAAVAPEVPSGRPWRDAHVEAAAAIAAYLRPYQDRLHLDCFKALESEWELQTATGTRVFWGRPPGAEGRNEAPAHRKVEHLLEFCKQQGSLGTTGEVYEHDVRPRDRAVHRLLSEHH